MNEASAAREQWMQRAGAFYPLLVAAQSQTRLPLTAGLVPSEQDRMRALPYAPLVGGILGVFLAFLAAVFVELELSYLVTGALLGAVGVLATGASFERNVGRLSERALARRQRKSSISVSAEDATLVIIVVAVLAIVIRVACLASIDAEHLTTTLIAAFVASRWMLTLIPALAAAETPWLLHLGVGGLVFLTLALCDGLSGVLLTALATVAAYSWNRWQKQSEAKDRVDCSEAAAVFALVLELVILF